MHPLSPASAVSNWSGDGLSQKAKRVTHLYSMRIYKAYTPYAQSKAEAGCVRDSYCLDTGALAVGFSPWFFSVIHIIIPTVQLYLYRSEKVPDFPMKPFLRRQTLPNNQPGIEASRDSHRSWKARQAVTSDLNQNTKNTRRRTESEAAPPPPAPALELSTHV